MVEQTTKTPTDWSSGRGKDDELKLLLMVVFDRIKPPKRRRNLRSARSK
jgi:hypothetical protein